MAKTTFFTCNKCGCPLQKPRDGYVIRGNIFVGNGEGGLIGGGPDDDPRESSFCKSCMREILDLPIIIRYT